MKNKNNWFNLPSRVANLETRGGDGIEVFNPNKEYNEGDIVLKVGEGIFRKIKPGTGIKVLSEQFFGSAEELVDHVDDGVVYPWKAYILGADIVHDYDSFVNFTNNNIEFLLAEAGGQTTIGELLFLYKGAVYTLTLGILTGNDWETLLINDKSFIKNYAMDLDLYYHRGSEVKAIKDYIYDNLIDILKVGDTVNNNQTKYNIFLTVVTNNSLVLRLVGYFFKDTTGSYSGDNMLRTDIELNLQKNDRNGTQTYCRVYEADTVYHAYSIDIKDSK